jgi:hypothetical protein
MPQSTKLTKNYSKNKTETIINNKNKKTLNFLKNNIKLTEKPNKGLHYDTYFLYPTPF